HVIHLDDRVRGHLTLHAEVPVMVAPDVHPRVGRPQAGGRGGRQRTPEKKIRHRANGRRLVVEGRLVEPERYHVVIDATVRMLGLIENPVTAAQHRSLSQGPPGEAQARTKLLLIRMRDRQWQPRLAAGLYEIPKQRVSGRSGELRSEINLIAVTGNNN